MKIIAAAYSRVVQVVIITLGANRSVSWVCGVVVLPRHVHEAWQAFVSVSPNKSLCRTHFVTNEVRESFLKADASNVVRISYCSPISNNIGTASASADCTSDVKIGAEHAAFSAAVKLVETDADTSSDIDGTVIPSMSSTARTIWTKFFWTV